MALGCAARTSFSQSEVTRAGETDYVGKFMGTTKFWRPNGQQYHVKGWDPEDKGEGGVLICMWKNKKPTRGRVDDESGEEGGDHLICTMRGTEWEPMPYPITIDSGASASILPKQCCQHVTLFETDGPRSGQTFNAANGQEIHNSGRRSVSFMTREGAIRDMKFEVCNVTRALGSVSQMCRAGHRVTFNPHGVPTGVILSTQRRGNGCG